MRVLVVGSGAREHALLMALRRDPAGDVFGDRPRQCGDRGDRAEQHDVDITSADAVVGWLRGSMPNWW